MIFCANLGCLIQSNEPRCSGSCRLKKLPAAEPQPPCLPPLLLVLLDGGYFFGSLPPASLLPGSAKIVPFEWADCGCAFLCVFGRSYQNIHVVKWIRFVAKQRLKEQ